MPTPPKDRRPTPAQEAQIRAVLAMDVEREDELIRERALEIAAECDELAGSARVPALDLDAWRLVDAFEGNPPMDALPGTDARTAAEVARQCRDLVARIDAGRR
jgi:hypothetical protein